MAKTVVRRWSRAALAAVVIAAIGCGDDEESPTTQCAWPAVATPTVVRFPTQADTHAAYVMYPFAVPAQNTTALRIQGEFPFAAFLAFAIYDANTGFLFDAITDYQISPDSGSVNPFQNGSRVAAQKRSYTVYLRPNGSAPLPNSIQMPPAADVTLVMRVYLPEPGKDRFGGVPLPRISPVSVNDLSTTTSCPTPSTVIPQLPSNLTQAPLPVDGRILFFRPPASGVPYADGESMLTAEDCTGYLMASVEGERVPVIHIHHLPQFFDNTMIQPDTIFAASEVRYVSIGSYGASPLTMQNIAGTDMRQTAQGGAFVVGIPHVLPDEVQAAIRARAEAMGANVLEMASPLRPLVKPFFIYRNKVATEGFAGSIKNVGCFLAGDFNQAPPSFASSPENMGEYFIDGIECDAADFIAGACPS
jgi:hypothetical protein